MYYTRITNLVPESRHLQDQYHSVRTRLVDQSFYPASQWLSFLILYKLDLPPLKYM